MSISTNITQDGRPHHCVDHEMVKLDGLDEIFNKYVIPTLVGIGMVLHILYWLFSLLRPMPPLRLYKRLLLVLSFMDFLQLTSWILEASRLVAYDISFWFFKRGSWEYLAALLPYYLQTFSSFSGILTIFWICVNCNHDIGINSSGVTGNFLKDLGDGKCFKSITMIFVISISLTTILQIQRRVVRPPQCFRTKDGEEVLVRYWKHDGPFGLYSILIEDVIYIAFLIFLAIETVVLIIRIRKHLAKATSYLFSSSSSPHNREVRELLNEQSDTRASTPNESHQAAFFLLLPMCVYYILYWTPKTLVDLINTVTSKRHGKGQIQGPLVIWLLKIIFMLNGIIDPITFLLASWMNRRGITPGLNLTTKSRRETQETNV